VPSFPYLNDLLVAVLGIDLPLPIPMFGLLVGMAIVVSTWVFSRNVRRAVEIGRLPDEAQHAIGDLSWTTVIAGVIGSRVFHILDHVDAFVQDPGAWIFTRGGFSIYGGICLGVVAGIVLLRRRGLPVLPMLDAVAPALMLGYGIGRIGCQVSGDGDWGIAANMALKPEWLPMWLWAERYAGNILGVPIALPGVYPTPIYESAAAIILFAALRLWGQRLPPAGSVFALYLLLTGFERLLIEKIRVNVRFPVLGMDFTQAEMISVVLILVGAAALTTALPTRRHWARLGIALGSLALLSACIMAKN